MPYQVHVLKLIVQVVCQRDLSGYKAAWRTAKNAVEIKSQWKFSNQSLTKAVADTCRTHLCVHSSDWELDDEVNFEGMVKTLEWAPVRPAMRMTRSTGWSHSWPAWWGTPITEKFEHALEEVRRQQNLLWKSVELDELCDLIPELGVLHAWTQDNWASTIYELMLLPKHNFGLKQHGVGRNGKDTLCNLPGLVCGDHRCLHVLQDSRLLICQGRYNEWADDLSRNRLERFAHRPADRVRFSPAEAPWRPEHLAAAAGHL